MSRSTPLKFGMSTSGRGAFSSESLRSITDINSDGNTRIVHGSAYADGNDPWSEERKDHNDATTKRNTKYGALLALAGILGYFGVAKGGISALFSKWFGGKSTDYDDVVNYNLGEDDPDGELAQLLSSFNSKSDNSWFKNLLGNNYSGFSFSGLFDGLGSTLSGFAGQLGSSWLNMKNMEHLIDKQNEYNTPSAQMQRFADAGLNPNLVYGLGNNGNQPTSGSIAPVDFDTSQRENRMARFSMDLQTKQFEADMMLKKAQAGLINSQAKGQNISNDINSATAESQKQTILQNLTNLKEQNNLTIEQKKKAIQETRNISLRNKWQDDISRLEKENLELDYAYKSIQNEWQPWVNGFDLFNKGASGLGSLGLNVGTIGNLVLKNKALVEGLGKKLPKSSGMSNSEMRRIFYELFQ